MMHLWQQALMALGQAAEQAANTAEKAGDVVGQAAQEVAQAAPAVADAAQNTTQQSSSWLSDLLGSGALGYLIEGGIFMWPILILGILGAGVIIERYRSLKLLSTDQEGLRDQVRDLLQHDRAEDALQLTENEQGPVAAILSAGLRKYVVLKRLGYDPAQMEPQVVKAMDDYGIHIVAALERHLPILATVASVAPMVGFLGTVQGMVVSFQDIVDQIGKTNIVQAAAAGIQIALLTTCFGLIVGIPAFLAYNYFTSVINRFVLDVEESASELMESVTLQIAIESRGLSQDSSPAPAAPLPGKRSATSAG